MPEFQYQLIPYEINSKHKLLIPDPAEVKAVHDQSAQSDGEVEFPYWTRIWPSAKGMAEYLLEEPHLIQNKRVVELGAGLGLPSFSVAHLAKSVVISDASRGAVQLLDINIQSIGWLHASALQIDWNNHHLPIPETDMLLLSDVCYDPSQYGRLLQLVEMYKNLGAGVRITAPQRISTGTFHELLSHLIVKTFLKKIGETQIAFFVL